MQLKRLGDGESARAGLQREGAGERVDPARAAPHGAVPTDGLGGFGAQGDAPEDGVEVVRGGEADEAEDAGGEGEVAGGRNGAELDEPRAGGGGLELAGDQEMGLELLDAGEGGAPLQQRVQPPHALPLPLPLPCVSLLRNHGFHGPEAWWCQWARRVLVFAKIADRCRSYTTRFYIRKKVRICS